MTPLTGLVTSGAQSFKDILEGVSGNPLSNLGTVSETQAGRWALSGTCLLFLNFLVFWALGAGLGLRKIMAIGGKKETGSFFSWTMQLSKKPWEDIGGDLEGQFLSL